MPDTGLMPLRLHIRNASKVFGRTSVLSEVNLQIRAGEIHGLVGQNGSGKSTLIKLLSGFHSAETGTAIEIDGVELSLPIKPTQLQKHGLAFVHQDLGLVSAASVVENVKIGRYTVGSATRRIRWKRDATDVSNILTTLGAGNIDPFAPVASLTHGERASVAIARAILGLPEGAGCIVFDESTQSLPREILHEFYAQVRRLAESGTAVVIVSHRLDEILALCDRVTVLEDGKVTVDALSTSGLNEADLTRLIMGSSQKASTITAGSVDGAKRAPFGPTIFSAVDVSGYNVHNASFEIQSGEIVGVIGNSESGFDELPYLLTGAERGRGAVIIDGETVSLQSLTPSRAASLGLGFVPGKRTEEGLAQDLAAFENVSLPRVGRGLRKLFLRRDWQEDEFQASAVDLGVTPPVAHLSIGSFSGGNQQKILLSKWLLNKPKTLILFEPTQAVDVGARADILNALRQQAHDGMAVLICSLEADDLAAVCDRVIVFRGGKPHTELLSDQITAHAIIDAAYGDLDSELQRTSPR